LDIREILRRLQLGERDRRIARDLHISRKTVGKYHEWAAAQGLLTGPLPDPMVLQAALTATLPVVRPPTTPSSVEPFRQRIVDLRKQGVECRAIHQILRDEGGFAGAYQSVYRFVRRLEPRTPEAVVRRETPPGDEAQVDFGYAGLMHDPRSGTRRKAWAFVMTLSFSRHSYP
jgi:transposase